MNDSDSVIKNLALKRASRRLCSSTDIKNYLLRKKANPDQIPAVVNRLIELGLVHDEMFTRTLVRSQNAQAKGPLIIRQKLKTHGITLSPEEITKLIEAESEKSPLEMAKAFVARRYPEAGTDKKEAHRALQALIRRGYSYQVARDSIP